MSSPRSPNAQRRERQQAATPAPSVKKPEVEVPPPTPLPAIAEAACQILQDLGFFTYLHSAENENTWSCRSILRLDPSDVLHSSIIRHTIESSPTSEGIKSILELEINGASNPDVAVDKFAEISLSLLLRLGLGEPELLKGQVYSPAPNAFNIEGHRIAFTEGARGRRMTVQLTYTQALSVSQREDMIRVWHQGIQRDVQRIERTRLEIEVRTRESLQASMAAWHDNYSQAIVGFKLSLSEVMASLEGKDRKLGRSCRRLANAAAIVRKNQPLFPTPDEAVGRAFLDMVQSYSVVAQHCTAGRMYETHFALVEASELLRMFAESLRPYSLEP